jgi:very-short-patch-repair endonuclease
MGSNSSGRSERVQRERRIVALAESQEGAIGRDQLLGLGLGASAIRHRLRTGSLHPMHAGVYLLGHSIPPKGAREWGAFLACGPDSLISHIHAIALHKLLPYPAPSLPINVTVPGGRRVRKRGIQIHHVNYIHPSERRALNRLPLTSAARAILEIAPDVTVQELELAYATAVRKGLTTRRQLEETLARHKGCRGAAAVRTLLDGGPPAFTRSRGERRLLASIRAAGLPEPECNVPIGPYEADLLWRAERVIFEIDGYDSHAGPTGFEHDRKRDAYLQARGYRVVRVSWDHVINDPDAVVSLVVAVLAQCAG